MTGSASPLEHRLREIRYRKAIESSEGVLDGLGVPKERRRVLDLDEVDAVWPRYVSRLRDGGDVRNTWPVDRLADVRRHVHDVRKATSCMAVVWLALVGSEPAGIEAPAEALLDAALGYLVSPAGDLMLTTSDVGDGICIERNQLADGDEYEIVAWGAFAQ